MTTDNITPNIERQTGKDKAFYVDIKTVPLIAEAMDEDGYITVKTNVPQEEFFQAHRNSVLDASDVDDFIHHRIFGFGMPYDSRVEVIDVPLPGVFRVEYTTKIGEFLDTSEYVLAE